MKWQVCSTSDEQGREYMRCICFDGKVQQHRYTFALQLISRGKCLLYGDVSQEVNTCLLRNSSMYLSYGVAGGIDCHFAIEGCVKRVLAAEMHDIMFLISYSDAICQKIMVVRIAR